LQYAWLKKDLTTVDRKRTPWLVVMKHVPWYSSNSGHQGESLLMQRDMEDVLFEAGVDIILNGHVHSYERTSSVHKGRAHACGPVHLNLGDGGNREGGKVPWTDPQPDWSLFRESSFGVARLVIHNATHAEYKWNRHACGASSDKAGHMDFNESCATPDDNSKDRLSTSDSAWVVRDQQACVNKQGPASPVPRQPLPSAGHCATAGVAIWFWVAVASASGWGLTLALVAVYFCRRRRSFERTLSVNNYVKYEDTLIQ